MLATSASAQWTSLTEPVTIGSLEGTSLIVGDKEFSGFNVDPPIVSGDPLISDPNFLTVQGVRWVEKDYYGLRFNGFSWNVGSNQAIAVNLSFKVSVRDEPEYEDFFIKDVWLKLTGAGATGTGVVSAGENVWDPQGNPIASLTCSAQAGDNGAHLLASADFAPLKEIYIENKHLSVSGNANGTAYFGEFFQFYSQTQVPEPATVCLLSLGGLILLRKRRKKHL
jgi:hypothetical protein